MSKINVGDLVKCVDEPELGLGLVVGTDLKMWGMPQEPPGVLVVWRNPTFYCPETGASTMYQDEVSVVSESRR